MNRNRGRGDSQSAIEGKMSLLESHRETLAINAGNFSRAGLVSPYGDENRFDVLAPNIVERAMGPVLARRGESHCQGQRCRVDEVAVQFDSNEAREFVEKMLGRCWKSDRRRGASGGRGAPDDRLRI